MALTASATLVVTPSGTWNPDPPAGHAGYNNTSGDKTWVPDENYYRRLKLQLTGDAGEYINIVNWEIYDGTVVPFVNDAAAVTVKATGGTYTAANAPAYLNNRTTRTVWVRNAKAADAGVPYYDETGTKWISVLRANGSRTVLEFPAYLRWEVTGLPLTGTLANRDSLTYEVCAFLPGSFGVPSASTSITITKPDVSLINDKSGSPQPR